MLLGDIVNFMQLYDCREWTDMHLEDEANDVINYQELRITPNINCHKSDIWKPSIGSLLDAADIYFVWNHTIIYVVAIGYPS